MKFIALLLPAIVVAALTTELESRQQQNLCDQYGYWSGNGYEMNNNEWGKDQGSGSQCTYLDNASGSGVSWHVTWTWMMVGRAEPGQELPLGGQDCAKGPPDQLYQQHAVIRVLELRQSEHPC